MSEDEKNQFLKTWQSDLQTSIPLPDRITSKYLLLSILRESENSCTCFVSAKENGRFFILKCSYTDSRNTTLREYKMLKLLSSLDTPQSIYIPSFMDYFEEDGISCLIRDYLYGSSFRNFVENSPDDKLAESLLKECALQLCEALDFLHSQNPPIIHRDIKPDNVIIDQYGHFRLIDFGIARLYQKNRNSDTTSMGSEYFAAPEQFGYSQTDARTDIYSLGALLLYGATCEYEINKLDYSDISDDFKKIIRKCMQFAPEDRYQNSSELRRDLEKSGKISLRRKKNRYFLRGTFCGAILTAALTCSVYFLFSSGLFPYSLSIQKNTQNPGTFRTDEAYTENTDDINDLSASQSASPLFKKTDAGKNDERLTDQGKETLPQNTLSPEKKELLADQEEIYIFKEPLIERAARVCLNKEEGEPVTVRDLRGIVFIGLYENKILSAFDDIHYSSGLPYISPKDIFDPDNILPNEISTLEDLTAMPNLRELTLCNIKLENLEYLDQLHLTSLALVGTRLSDFEKVSSQSDLENLVIIPREGNLHFDLPFLPELEKLSDLNICNIIFDDGYDFLPRIPSLQSLTVSSMPDDFIEALRKTSVRNLCLWYTRIQAPSPPPPLSRLSGCTSLEDVSIFLGELPFFLDDESPSDLPNLKRLVLSDYYFRDFACLSSLEHLEDLIFIGYDSTECILDCKNLDKLPSLKRIYCSQEVHKMLEEYYPERSFELISD